MFGLESVKAYRIGDISVVKVSILGHKNLIIGSQALFFRNICGRATFYFYFFLPFANKNDVPTMFRKNFRLLISGAESRERVHQNSANQPTILTTGYNNQCKIP